MSFSWLGFTQDMAGLWSSPPRLSRTPNPRPPDILLLRGGDWFFDLFFFFFCSSQETSPRNYIPHRCPPSLGVQKPIPRSPETHPPESRTPSPPRSPELHPHQSPEPHSLESRTSSPGVQNLISGVQNPILRSRSSSPSPTSALRSLDQSSDPR